MLREASVESAPVAFASAVFVSAAAMLGRSPKTNVIERIAEKSHPPVF